MTERAERLRGVICGEVLLGLDEEVHFDNSDAKDVLAAIVTELFTTSNPHAVRMAADELVALNFDPGGALVTELRALADALAVLLEASR